MSNHSQPAPGKRDPEGRRRAILHAAAEIIVSRGPAALTHRAVASAAGVALGSTTQYFATIDELREAALADLAAEIDESLAALEAELRPDNIPTILANTMHEFLRDKRAVHADMALMTSAMRDPHLRPLAQRWTDRLIEILSRYLDPPIARAIALYADGATMHAGLHDAPISEAELQSVMQRLVGAKPG